jgi:hypothetical protein
MTHSEASKARAIRNQWRQGFKKKTIARVLGVSEEFVREVIECRQSKNERYQVRRALADLREDGEVLAKFGGNESAREACIKAVFG